MKSDYLAHIFSAIFWGLMVVMTTGAMYLAHLEQALTWKVLGFATLSTIMTFFSLEHVAYARAQSRRDKIMTTYRAIIATLWGAGGVCTAIAAALHMYNQQAPDLTVVGLLLVAAIDFYMMQENLSRGRIE